jgi:hypothetical protein
LRNFLEGCALANLKFKRIILQTGGKVSSHGVDLVTGLELVADRLGSIMVFIKDRIRYVLATFYPLEMSGADADSEGTR